MRRTAPELVAGPRAVRPPTVRGLPWKNFWSLLKRTLAYDGLDQDYALSERAQMANVTVTPDGWRASKTIGW